MRSGGNRLASLMGLAQVLALSAGGAAADLAAPKLRTAGEGDNRRPTPPRTSTALQREIAEGNAAVEARKQAKALAKQRRQARSTVE